MSISITFIDRNKLQIDGTTENVMKLEPLIDKWKAFGWDSAEVDGHDIEALTKALSVMKKRRKKPFALIAHTIKGRGVSFMEDDNNWHYRIPNAAELEQALKELET